MPLMPESPTASKSKTNLYILLLHLEERGGREEEGNTKSCWRREKRTQKPSQHLSLLRIVIWKLLLLLPTYLVGGKK